MRVIVAGIGYRNLRDHSVGIAVTDRLLERAWPGDVVVEDLSYNPIAVIQRLEDEPPEQRFTRAVVVGAVERGNRAPGSVIAYQWDGILPSDEEIQRAVTEAVTKPWKLLKLGAQGIRTEGEMAPEISLENQRPAESR